MKFGFVMTGGNARTAANLAYEAEQAGWDGFYVYEPVWGIDAWVSLTAAAMRTERIRLGTMLTPISRMRPWKLASETATLDHLSGGRVTLAVGLGATDTGFTEFGEVTDRKTRAELMDEGLDVLTGLWKGQPFTYSGKHYQIKEMHFNPPPPPVQQLRIPIWVVGAWGSEKSMQRVIKYDGLLPSVSRKAADGTRRTEQASPDEVRQMAAFITEHRKDKAPFDIIVEGETPGDDPKAAREKIMPWEQAGATWWIEALWMRTMNAKDPIGILRERISQGPPG
jgi:alkanesulfonate monooxygenase SsuD/methylene tetrahydromethanopterin reductase-like flavin-dependent oxidoreductase (luciferase family)